MVYDKFTELKRQGMDPVSALKEALLYADRMWAGQDATPTKKKGKAPRAG